MFGGLTGVKLTTSLRQVLFDVEKEIQIWPKVLVKKITMQCIKIKTHTDACYPCKINKTNHFSPILVTSIHKTDFFSDYRDLYGIPIYIPEAVFSFLPMC